MDDLYSLDDDGNPVAIHDIKEWVAAFQKINRRVAEVFVRKSRISTVFLGLDNNYRGGGGPVLWETMIFGGKFDGEQWRYRTRHEALEGHVAAVRKVVLEDRE